MTITMKLCREWCCSSSEKMSSYFWFKSCLCNEYVYKFKFKFRAGRAGVVDSLKKQVEGRK
jgi:hypothetical protein